MKELISICVCTSGSNGHWPVGGVRFLAYNSFHYIVIVIVLSVINIEVYDFLSGEQMQMYDHINQGYR